MESFIVSMVFIVGVSFLAEMFISGGARGYIGCLWNIQNNDAVNFAKSFYSQLFSDTLLNVFHGALQTIKGNESENIYVYWGLPHTNFQKANINQARHRIQAQLRLSYILYEMNLEKSTNSKTINLLKDLLNWIRQEIMPEFHNEFIADTIRMQQILKDKKLSINKKHGIPQRK
jgi:hypothetical protein